MDSQQIWQRGCSLKTLCHEKQGWDGAACIYHRGIEGIVIVSQEHRLYDFIHEVFLQIQHVSTIGMRLTVRHYMFYFGGRLKSLVSYEGRLKSLDRMIY